MLLAVAVRAWSQGCEHAHVVSVCVCGWWYVWHVAALSICSVCDEEAVHVLSLRCVLLLAAWALTVAVY